MGMTLPGFVAPLVLRAFPWITGKLFSFTDAQGEVRTLVKEKVAKVLIERRNNGISDADDLRTDLLDVLMRSTDMEDPDQVSDMLDQVCQSNRCGNIMLTTSIDQYYHVGLTSRTSQTVLTICLPLPASRGMKQYRKSDCDWNEHCSLPRFTRKTLAMTAWEVARRPELQSALREELSQFKGGKSGRPRYDDFTGTKLPLLDAVVKEA